MKRSISPIRCTGSKRKVAEYISPLFPENKYIVEPFVGGGNFFQYYYDKIEFCLAMDINKEYIQMYNDIQFNDGNELLNYYTDIYDKKNYEIEYYAIRAEYNIDRDYRKLFLLSYFSMNNLIRYNSSGNFNAAIDKTLKFTHPDKLRQYIENYIPLLKPVTFIHGDYKFSKDYILNNNAFCIFDPPYENKAYNNIYMQNVFDMHEFEIFLRELNFYNIKYLITLSSKDILSSDLYKRKFESGKKYSSFSGISNKKATHHDNIYINY